MLGVHPKLVKQIHQRHNAKQQRRHAQHRHGQIKHPAKQRAGRRLAQRSRQVVVLALVVRHVRSPKQRHLVPGPVQPVVAKVVQHQRQKPAIPVVPQIGLRPQRHAAKQRGINGYANEFAKHPRHLAEHAHAQAAQGVAQAVAAFGHRSAGRCQAHMAPVPPQLQRDQQQKDREGENDDFGHGANNILPAETRQSPVGRRARPCLAGVLRRLRPWFRRARRLPGGRYRPSPPGSAPRASTAGG